MIMHMFDEELAIGIIRLGESAIAGGLGLEAFNYLIKSTGLAVVFIAFAGLVADVVAK